MHMISHLKRLLQLLIILLLTIGVFITIWKLFITHDEVTAANYRTLSTISPEVIIQYQKQKPESWKNYVAVISASQSLSQSNSAKNSNNLNKLLQQLDQNIKLKNIDWSDVDKNMKIKAQTYRTLLDKYPIYTPDNYLFPLRESYYYTDTYGAEREGGNRVHEGTDLFDDKGTPIVSVCDGIVEKLGWNRLGGERVGVRGNDGNYYYYAHLDTINKKLIVGEKISKGELIGTMGNTGDAITTPDHLHFGIELPNGEWVNPYSFLKVWEYQFGN